jgi:hypothetical protein
MLKETNFISLPFLSAKVWRDGNEFLGKSHGDKREKTAIKAEGENM